MSGSELKEILYKAHIQQRDIAEQLGMSKQSFGNMLNKTEDIKSGTLEKIAEVLNLPMSFFYPSCEATEINNVYARGRNVNTGDGNYNEGGSTELATRLLDELSELRKTNQQLMETNQKLMNKLFG